MSSTSSELSLVTDRVAGDILGDRALWETGDRALCEPGDRGGLKLEFDSCLCGALRDCCLLTACWSEREFDLGTFGDTGVASCSPMAGSGDMDLGMSK